MKRLVVLITASALFGAASASAWSGPIPGNTQGGTDAGCTGNPHDVEQPKGNPHDAGKQTGNPHECEVGAPVTHVCPAPAPVPIVAPCPCAVQPPATPASHKSVVKHRRKHRRHRRHHHHHAPRFAG